jgi:transcriptional regulator with XRE-family HTH domain
MNRLGEKVRVLRKQHGLTQTELSNMLDIDHSHVGRIERGERIPHLTILLKLSEIFQISLDQLAKDELDIE